MGRLLLLGIVMSVATLGSVAQGADLAGEECGSSTPLAPASAGALEPGEEHWYDASFAQGSQTLRLRTADVSGTLGTPTLGLPVEASWVGMRIYEWDTSAEECTQIADTSCFFGGVISANPLSCWTNDFSYTLDDPGAYQVSVEHRRGNSDPTMPATNYVATVTPA